MAMGFVLSSVTLSTNFAFKNLGLPNGTITMLASVPHAALRPEVPLGAAAGELYRTKKFWVVSTQIGIAAGLALAGLALQLPAWLAFCFGALMLCSILGATQDVGADGVYVTTLNAKQQAGYAGIQSMAWTAGPLIATGALVPLAGWLHTTRARAGERRLDDRLHRRRHLPHRRGPLAHLHPAPGGKSADAPKNAAER
jgi:PAT family beta-lactamase induction signal transducer AmpG